MNYEAWLKMGHVDNPNSAHCKSCNMPYEEFTARKLTCREYTEEKGIEEKKRVDDSDGPMPPWYKRSSYC